MSRMRRVEVDPVRRVARVGAGCLLGNVDRATQEHGLATVLGSDAQTLPPGRISSGGAATAPAWRLVSRPDLMERPHRPPLSFALWSHRGTVVRGAPRNPLLAREDLPPEQPGASVAPHVSVGDVVERDRVG
jgi:hypothetical protein